MIRIPSLHCLVQRTEIPPSSMVWREKKKSKNKKKVHSTLLPKDSLDVKRVKLAKILSNSFHQQVESIPQNLAFMFALTHRMRQVLMGGGKDREEMASAGLNHNHPCSAVTERRTVT